MLSVKTPICNIPIYQRMLRLHILGRYISGKRNKKSNTVTLLRFRPPQPW